MMAQGRVGNLDLEAVFFFFQAEDGIRDLTVTGVQTCALPISLEEEQPYAMAFIDMRMPPGWDGLETIQRLWQIDPHVQVVICSAHSDYDWTEVVARLDHSDKLLVIKKPFEPIEVLQCANALTRKWDNERTLRRQVDHLEQDRKSTRLNSSHSQTSY